MMLEDILKKEKKWKKRIRVKLQKYLSLYLSLSPYIYIITQTLKYVILSFADFSINSPSLTLTLIRTSLMVSPSHPHPHSHSLTDPLLLAACHEGAWISWWLLFVTEEHEIVRLERDMMIGGALGRVEVRRNPEVGLMAETSAVRALVVWVFPSFFGGICRVTVNRDLI